MRKETLKLIAIMVVFVSCSKEILSSHVELLGGEKKILSFQFLASENGAIDQDYLGYIDQETKTISITLPFGTDLKTLKPNMQITEESTIEPNNKIHDFTNLVEFKVTGRDRSSEIYSVMVKLPEMSERDALIAMYNDSDPSSKGSLNWDLEAQDMNSWSGVEADGNKVKALEFQTSHIFLTKDVKNLMHLEKIKIFSSNIVISREITELKTLKSINIGLKGTDIEYVPIPESIGDLENLEELVWNFTDLTSIPSGIGDLKKLKILSLGANALTTIPSTITELSLLTELKLGENQLSELPEGMDKLTNLKTLYLSAKYTTKIE